MSLEIQAVELVESQVVLLHYMFTVYERLAMREIRVSPQKYATVTRS